MNYQKLYEKHAKGARNRAVMHIVTGVLSVAGGVLLLKQLRDEQREGTGAK
jgi:hypothetical protein